jgi:hypothetical protein
MICVMRVVNGVESVIVLFDQLNWKEWSGAFSLLPVTNKENT